MKVVLALLLACAATAPAVAAPSPAPQVATTPDPMAQVRSLETLLRSVYAPYCTAHHGVAKVDLPTKNAWPAVVYCVDGSKLVELGPPE